MAKKVKLSYTDLGVTLWWKSCRKLCC